MPDSAMHMQTNMSDLVKLIQQRKNDMLLEMASCIEANIWAEYGHAEPLPSVPWHVRAARKLSRPFVFTYWRIHDAIGVLFHGLPDQ